MAAWNLHTPNDMVRFVVLLLVAGCTRSEAQRDPSRGESTARERPALTETRQKAPVTPEIVERSEKILAEHADSPVGTEIPFTLSGRRYVARVEMHDNQDASPDRPPGEHKGITVYVAP